MIDNDDGERDDDGGYSMAEALGGAYFEYIKCHSTVSGVQNGTRILYLFTTGWERGIIQPNTLCNTTQKRQMK